MKAVIYARYSSDSQTENSIEGQIRECKAYAEKQGQLMSPYIIGGTKCVKPEEVTVEPLTKPVPVL